MDTSYWTRAEFRAFAQLSAPEIPQGGDAEAILATDNARLDAVQVEVVERLERWARTAWPTVDETKETPGDGYTNEPRRVVETLRSESLALAHVPVLEVTEVSVDGSDVSLDVFRTWGGEGFLVPYGRLRRGGQAIVTYTYGFSSTPMSIKRPAMLAAKSLLESAPGRSKIPRRTSQMTTERTTFIFKEEPELVLPWPWDEEASDQVRAYWGPDRPRMVGAI